MSKFRNIVEEFYSTEECIKLINDSEAKGYSEALIRTRGQGEAMNKDIRDNDRVIWDSPELAEELYQRIKGYVPEFIDDWKVMGLNERFRFYRYKDGQRFKPHVDGAYKRSDDEISFITLLIYLNEGYEGGSTYLIGLDEEVKPKEGMLLLFDHKILHAGMSVTNGVKYVIRTDVMYKKQI